MPETESHLSGRELRQSFRMGSRTVDVLKGISIDIHRGETIFLCGASGAGKTTLLYTLAGLERPVSGSVHFEGSDVYRMPDGARARQRNARIGFVFQGYFLLPEFTALENVLLPGLIGSTADREAATEALRQVGLADRMHHLPSELSGGEQQRVAIARALIRQPTIIFADEPTGNLDSRTGEEIVEMLLGATKATGATLVVVTHDPHLATRGDRRIEIQDGLLVKN